MAGGTITRTAFGASTDVVDNDFTGHYNKLSMNAGGHHAFKANVTNYGNPKDLPPAGKYFTKGWWTDENNKEIKETTIGEKVRFHIRTQNIPDGGKVIFYVYEWDGLKIFSDKLDLVKSGTSQISNEIDINSNTGYIEWITGEGALSFFNENLEGVEIELFVECTYKEEQLDLPLAESNYLILYEKEVLITVIVELPHSKETGWGAKGLAGHSAMAIGERYFDYGPNNSPGTYSEQDYDVDFNDDGDRVDNVNLSNPSFKNAPGMPWWGTHIAIKNNITPEQVTLQMVYQYLSIPWNDTVDVNGNIVQYGTNIYGKVHKIEFYVKESEAKKMIKWWEERYKHLKIYSVFPWTGEQCTTTVKTAIQQAFPLEYFGDNKNYIPDETQKPSGLLNDLQKFLSTSKQHLDKKSVVTIIKQEASNWVP